ncbi:hypothetical protein U6X42_12250, partial [Cutibacterium acnes]
YIDELYQAVIIAPYRVLAQVLEWIDTFVVGGVVRWITSAAFGIGRIGIRLQNGQLQTYGLMILFGCILFIAAIAGRRFF